MIKLKKYKRFVNNLILVVIVIIVFINQSVVHAENNYSDIESYVESIIQDAKVPGLSVIILNDDDSYIKGYGYADLEQKILVNEHTKFELASCSKAFTALAILRLKDDGIIQLNDTVSKYVQGFTVTYNKEKYDITIEQLLHHTSGIPNDILSYISAGDEDDSLAETVQNFNGIVLNNEPGKIYEYSSANYDMLGLIIEKVTKLSFEEYMETSVFEALGLLNTTIKKSGPLEKLAKGYKIGFSKPIEYDSPIYRGNNPAAYVISDSVDILKWMKHQISTENEEFKLIIDESHVPDRSVNPDTLDYSSYAAGWKIYQNGLGEISHSGLNPNFTSYITLRPNEKIGVAILANSNSSYIPNIAKHIMSLLINTEYVDYYPANTSLDKTSIVVAVILIMYNLIILISFIGCILQIIMKKRKIEHLNAKSIKSFIGVLLCFIPFFIGLYFLPNIIGNYSWENIRVWAPISLMFDVYFIIFSFIISYIMFIVVKLFPSENKYKRDLLFITILSILSGGANTGIVLLITKSMNTDNVPSIMLYYFILATFLYLVGRKIVETKLIKIAYDVVFEIRMKLIRKTFNMTYNDFERIDSGKIYTTLHNDTEAIAEAANLSVFFATSIATVVCATIYLAIISFKATLTMIFIIAFISGIYQFACSKTLPYFEEARDTQNVFIKLVEGIVRGFKELTMHHKKKILYQNDIEDVCEIYREKSSMIKVKFTNAFLIGESMFIIVLGSICFGFTKIFTSLDQQTFSSFVVILLYLIGPINSTLKSISKIMSMKTSWNRIRKFINEIPLRNIEENMSEIEGDYDITVNTFEIRNIGFEYNLEINKFKIGPVDLKLNKGDVVFVIGGNGSGKTTLAKLITGLYSPTEGEILINDRIISKNQIGEYISAIFSDFYLFEKCYDLDLSDREEIEKIIKMLGLENKVKIENGKFSTINLSSGQRKRLALLECFLDNRPIYLFDEWAADQDPQFRGIFYNKLLPKMKQEGKIIIAITHDEQYFHVADKILKMNMGNAELIKNPHKINASSIF